jgi:hypothetical protein
LFGDGWETLYRTRIDAFSLIRSGRAWRWFDIWAMPLGVFFRTSLLRALGGYSLKYPIVGDLDLWYRAASLEPAVDVVHTGAVAGRFRVHGGSLSTGDRMDRMFVEKLAFLQSLIDSPDTPAGVRTSARRMFRHDVLALAFWNAKNRSVSQLPAEMAARFQQFRAAGPGALLDFVSALPIGVHDALVDVARVGPLVNSLWALTGGPEHRRDDWVSRAERPAKDRSRTAVR